MNPEPVLVCHSAKRQRHKTENKVMRQQEGKKEEREERRRKKGRGRGSEEERKGGREKENMLTIFICFVLTFLQRRFLSSQLAHEKMIKIISHQEKWKSEP
jgi:hypothetical protein